MKTAFITGGGGDIGAAIARLASERGYRCGVVDLDLDRASAVAEQLAGAVPLQADVSDEGSVTRALDAFGATPDLVVNNAGFVRFGPLLDLPFADFRRVVDINLVGAHITAVLCARRMVQRGSGAIVNITSIAGVTPNPNGGAYAATKAGLAMHTELMAIEWGPLGLRVNAVAPGFIDAGMSAPFFKDPLIRERRQAAVPTRRLGLAEDVAKAVLFLGSAEADYINGQTLIVDGGVTSNLLAIAPRSREG
jgi:NAD(P)-dependent dehydrogenase (short-subunit alcohol dehydrogenase family)